jgi:hypothetical protein
MMTKFKLALLLAAPLVGGIATYAAADNTAAGNGRHEALTQKFDTNGDGVLDDAERAKMKEAFAAKRAARKQAMLAKYDTNKDGKLEKTERVAMADDLAAKRFAALDKNGDGKLTLDEFKAGAEARATHMHRRHHKLDKATAPATGTTTTPTKA